jgi:hypothetical protein
MKPSARVVLCSTVFLSISVATCLLIWLYAIERDAQEMRTQSQQLRKILAQELGAKDFNDYLFPANHFRTELREGTPITVVHTMVRGYVQAYKCPNNREVYDFYSVERPLRIRMQIFYDERLHYVEDRSLTIDDHNSNSIKMTDCVLGRIEE